MSRLFARLFHPQDSSLRVLYVVGSMIFFWALFDASFSYIVPIAIVHAGYSKTFMGVILGSSSVFGAGFDYVLSSVVRNTHFRRIYLAMLAICAICPLLLWQGHALWILVSAMACWGLYYDLSNFGNLDFVSRKARVYDHSRYFGILWVFRSLGYTIGPLLIGIIIDANFSLRPFLSLWVLLAISAILFFVLTIISRHSANEYLPSRIRSLKEFPSSKSEIILWIRIVRYLYPVLLLTSYFWIYDAFFWTIGPLISSTLPIVGKVNGIFVTSYVLPFFVFGFLVSLMNKRLGKKHTAQIFGIFAGIVLMSLFILKSSELTLLAVLIASGFVAFCIPSLNAAYADYVQENPFLEKEIQALQDFFTNLAYIIGPIIAGYLADRVGNLSSFGVLGLLGIATNLTLFFITPHHITLKKLYR